MAQRFSSVLATDTSASFSPSDDQVVQIDSAIPVTIDVEVRMDASLSWGLAYSLRSDAEPVTRFKKVPFMRYQLRGNTAGNPVKIYDNL